MNPEKGGKLAAKSDRQENKRKTRNAKKNQLRMVAVPVAIGE